MAEEDLQAFRSHAPLWKDGEQTGEGGGGAEGAAGRVSWPLTSFANTIQNVCCISLILGFLLALNLVALFLSPRNSPWAPLHIYALFLLLFHLLEFLTTAVFNPSRVTVDSFLLNNGASYWYAQMFSVLEYVVREKYFGGIGLGGGGFQVVGGVGLGMTVCGQMVRTVAMVTAAGSFNHRVSTHASRQPDHTLVTHGIYRLFRHPSYFGFFWWSLGLQLFLNNALATALFAYVLWSFFHHRIQTEELHLIKFFGKPYLDYRAATPTCIPFIK